MSECRADNHLYELSFRAPLPVVEVLYFRFGGTSYPVCPRCRMTLEREYMNFCDRCGQRLDWKSLGSALVRIVPDSALRE